MTQGSQPDTAEEGKTHLCLDDAVKDGMYELLFILLPAQYKGATASVVRPVGVI